MILNKSPFEAGCCWETMYNIPSQLFLMMRHVELPIHVPMWLTFAVGNDAITISHHKLSDTN